MAVYKVSPDCALCKSCEYYRPKNSHHSTCDYIGVEGHSRIWDGYKRKVEKGYCNTYKKRERIRSKGEDMDTQRDIERDRYYQEYQDSCGTCHYYTKEEDGRHSCMCMDSPFAADWVDAEDGCNCYVMRR